MLHLPSAVSDPGDPYLNTWILEWDWWATLHRPLSLFHANIFYPARYSLAFSEHMYGIALLLFPFYAAGLGAITVYNLGMLLGFAFSGYGAFVLARMVTRSMPSALAAGIFFAFVPFRFTQLTHIQHVWAGWLPLLFAALLHHLRGPGWTRAALLGAALLMNGLSNVHWFFFGATTLVLSVVFLAATDARARSVRFLVPLVTATALAGLLLVPFFLPYKRVSEIYGVTRREGEVRGGSARVRDWFTPTALSKTYGKFHPMVKTAHAERELFPGALSLLLSFIAMVFPRRDRVDLTGFRLGILWLAVGFLGSRGLRTFFYELLYEPVYGFAAIRVAARFAMVAYVGLAVLIAVGVVAILARVQQRARNLAGILVPLLFLVELRVAPLRWYLALPEPPPVYRWLAGAPISGSVVELPFGNWEEAEYVLRSTAHHRPIVNGVSGYFPQFHRDSARMANADPVDPGLMARLESLRCSLVVVHNENMNTRPAVLQWLREQLASERLIFVRRFEHGAGGDYVFAVAASESRSMTKLRGAELRDSSGMTDQEKATQFLGGNPYVYNSSTFGWIDEPAPGTTVDGKLHVFGWALSPHGVDRVDLRLQNGSVIIPAEPIAFDALRAKYPWYPPSRYTGFIKDFPERPSGVREETDLQVELIDGSGKRTRLKAITLRWLR